MSTVLLCPDDRSKMRSLFAYLRSDPTCRVPEELESFFLDHLLKVAEEKRLAGVRICDKVKVVGKCKVCLFKVSLCSLVNVEFSSFQDKSFCPLRHIFDSRSDLGYSNVSNGSRVFFRQVVGEDIRRIT